MGCFVATIKVVCIGIGSYLEVIEGWLMFSNGRLVVDKMMMMKGGFRFDFQISQCVTHMKFINLETVT